MHRSLTVTLPPDRTDTLVAQLMPLADVVGLSVERGTSQKPPGDIIGLQVLNRGADDVLRRVAEVCEGATYSVATAELASLSDRNSKDAIENDYDEAIWEEMETGLRHNGLITTNYLALMALGGVVAAVGLVSDPAPQAVAFVAAAIIAPGYDPLAKVALGVVLRKTELIGIGLRSTLAGYGLLIALAAGAFWLLRATGHVNVADFVDNPEVNALANPDAKAVLLSVAGALAGGIITTSYRDAFIAGPLVALAFIQAAAMVGVGAAAGEWTYAAEGASRFGVDALLIVSGCYVVKALKQRFVHQRKPLV